MVKQVKLRGQVRLNMDRTFTFLGKLYDGTQFECTVDIHDFELADDFEPGRYTVDGWLFVVQEAQQADRCYLTIPKPSIVYGRQILVNELQLMPRVASINDFKPQKIGGGKVTQAKYTGGQIVEVEGDAVGDLVAVLAEEASKPKANKKSSKS